MERSLSQQFAAGVANAFGVDVDRPAAKVIPSSTLKKLPNSSTVVPSIKRIPTVKTGQNTNPVAKQMQAQKQAKLRRSREERKRQFAVQKRKDRAQRRKRLEAQKQQELLQQNSRLKKELAVCSQSKSVLQKPAYFGRKSSIAPVKSRPSVLTKRRSSSRSGVRSLMAKVRALKKKGSPGRSSMSIKRRPPSMRSQSRRSVSAPKKPVVKQTRKKRSLFKKVIRHHPVAIAGRGLKRLFRRRKRKR
ncbi:hypothetical protein PEDI_55170 [Persicobacter diffluens]|uniref:Uncharacterized protein n=2 Tax=Persicobacter diffluens TaxID=981 RepID=A0AAN4W5J8_9BACT|nr:hypothetical protein PEDI_55170 [Persicobacter diffluens]